MDTRSLSSFCILTYLLFLTAYTSPLVKGEIRRPRNVEVAIQAKWPGTPILLEAGELLAKDWKELYWGFIDGWHRKEEIRDRERNTSKQCFDVITKHGRSFLDEPLASAFEFSLNLRSVSPRLVLYRQLAEESLSSFPLSDEDFSATGNDAMKMDSVTSELNANEDTGHCCWVDTGGSVYFDVAELLMWLRGNSERAEDPFHSPELFDFDHIYPHWKAGAPIAILYGALGMKCFREFHDVLVENAKEGKVKYIVRPVLPSGCEHKADPCSALGTGVKINLGGYGVELALKNMEYKAIDDSTVRQGITLEDPRTDDLSQEVRGFIFSKILERKSEVSSEIMAFRDYLLSSTISDTLNVWELKDLGHQTAQRIVHASDPLLSMQEINQNFPSIVSSLSRTKLESSIKDEIIANQRMIPPGKSLMALNGALINIDDIDLYMMIDLVQQDLLIADQLEKLKVPHSTIRMLLSMLSPPESKPFRVDFRSEHVHYINNIEEDAMYKRWRSNINEILMPVFPGQLRYIRKNIFHAVYVLDPASTHGLEAIESMISNYESSFPMRFGLLLYSTKVIEKIELDGGHDLLKSKDALYDEDVSTMVIRIFLYVKENYGIQMALQLLKKLNGLRLESSNPDRLEWHQVEEAFAQTLSSKETSNSQDIFLKLVKERIFLESVFESSSLVFNLGLSKLQSCIIMNGHVLDSSEDALLNAMNEELQRIQEEVYYGHINSRTDVLDKFLSESGINRYNLEIIGNGKVQQKYVSLVSMTRGRGTIMNEVSYLHSPGSSDIVKPITHLVVVDSSSTNGTKLIVEGIRYLIDGSKLGRIGFLFNSNSGSNMLGLVFIKAFNVAASLHSYKKNVLFFLQDLCLLFDQMHVFPKPDESVESFISQINGLTAKYEMTSDDFNFDITNFNVGETRRQLNEVSQSLLNKFNLDSVANSVVTNGRVTPVEGSFLRHDFLLLESLEYQRRVKQISEVFEDVQWQDLDPDMITSKFVSDIIMYASSAMSIRERSSETARFELLHAEHSAVIVDSENSSIHIDAIIDPLSRAGQKLAPLLIFCRKYFKPSMRIVLNPLSSLADLPLKNYYRYVMPTMGDLNSCKAFFANMPLSKTLTMNLDVPEPWLTEPVIAVHDLDNILLENLVDAKTLYAVFELEALVLTGHCSEKDHDSPRGLQLILGTKSTPHLVDTLVMANLGYWQMKVSPGVLYLQLAPGRSSDIYVLSEDVEKIQNMHLLKQIIINDLRGKVVHLDVMKKAGMERENLLMGDDDDQKKKGSPSSWNANILKWASGFIPRGRESGTEVKRIANTGSRERHGRTINIFSIASGHLYERFLKIMILSVLKNTKRPVKFWFIKNYLSPQFKDVIPHMAQEYDFDYELVTYKWPTWLHKQKEKQRIIWAYKILFLDVIFPLSLEKVIFVDADQVVRADMGELYDMDIKGRPLAYTPFCDNNKDMDGYRFWRQGFWRDHLRGRPYHISALYVVDLRKFRETAAGDHLRIFYENLSKDPNSLSNLDQDLPNYAQHTVPIFSLPQEWLWCESWCGNSTKTKAKTIDLCNNPMTKEPKLQGARRIVTEWVALDTEARKFTAKILGDELDDLQEPSPAPTPQTSANNSPADQEDLESKSEL